MTLYDAVSALPLRIEGYDLSHPERDTSSGFTRTTTVVSLHGKGRTGRGEDVTYESEEHYALRDVEDPFERLDDGAGPGERTPVGDADPFEEVDVGTAGEDASWEELLPTEPTDGTGIDPTTVGETVVPKRRYCQGCEHFTAPPAVACTHAHGEIVEVVDVDHFRVRNCPVVAHRRERPVYDDEPGIEGDED